MGEQLKISRISSKTDGLPPENMDRVGPLYARVSSLDPLAEKRDRSLGQ